MKKEKIINIHIDQLIGKVEVGSKTDLADLETHMAAMFKRILEEADKELTARDHSCNMTLKARVEQGLREMRQASSKGVVWSSEAKRVKKDKPKDLPLQALYLNMSRKECEEKYLSLMEQAAVLAKEIELIDSQLK